MLPLFTSCQSPDGVAQGPARILRPEVWAAVGSACAEPVHYVTLDSTALSWSPEALSVMHGRQQRWSSLLSAFVAGEPSESEVYEVLGSGGGVCVCVCARTCDVLMHARGQWR